MPAFRRLYRAYGLLLRGCGAIAQIALFMLLMVVVVDTLAGFVIGGPLIRMPLDTETLLVPTVFLALALTQYEGGHSRVIVFTRGMRRHRARVLTVGSMLAGAVFFAWCAYAAFDFGLPLGTAGAGGMLPFAPSRLVMAVGTALLAVQFLLDAIAETMMPIAADDERAMERL